MGGRSLLLRIATASGRSPHSSIEQAMRYSCRRSNSCSGVCSRSDYYRTSSVWRSLAAVNKSLRITPLDGTFASAFN
jgi:hypothetical protein